jgi:hypothetical protein
LCTPVARALPSFQTRYFWFRQPVPRGTEYPDESESINPRTHTPSPSLMSTTTSATAAPPPPPLLLPSDVRITLTGTFSSSDAQGDPTTAIFSSHRFILVSRSPYFHTALFVILVQGTAHSRFTITSIHTCLTAFHSGFYLYWHTHFLSSFL